MQANAAFIERACNNHETLVTAAREVVEYARMHGGPNDYAALGRLDAAIAAAQAK